MPQSIRAATWWKFVLSGALGAVVVSSLAWASRGSQQPGAGPVSQKFWPSEFGAGRPARSCEPDHAREGRRCRAAGE